VLLALTGLVMWVLYASEAGFFTIFGNCGPEGMLGRAGNWQGGFHESLPTAGAIGGLLVIITWLAMGFFPKRIAMLVYSFIAVFAASLVVLALGVAPAIWGPRHCLIS
jgi:hypothetical protein